MPNPFLAPQKFFNMSVPFGGNDIANFGINAFWSGIALSNTQTTYYQVPFGFITQGMTITNRGTGPVNVSFDGINKHGELTSATPENQFTFHKRHQNQIFLQNQNGLSGTNTVTVTAW
jgi:hypothetical protein